jgi:phosphopantetheine adenylyltransferase
MTPAELADLTARAERIERIIRALQAFDDCRYEIDVARCDSELKEALAGEPKIPVDAP